MKGSYHNLTPMIRDLARSRERLMRVTNDRAMTGASTFNIIGWIPADPDDLDGLKLKKRLDTRKGVTTIGGI